MARLHASCAWPRCFNPCANEPLRCLFLPCDCPLSYPPLFSTVAPVASLISAPVLYHPAVQLVVPEGSLRLQVSVQMHVDSSRAICSAVAKGEVDIAIIGGEVPEELRDLVQASGGSV